MNASPAPTDHPQTRPADAPFGAYRPTGLSAVILALTQNTPLGRGSARKSLGEILRRNTLSPVDAALWGRNARLHLTSNYSEMKALLNPSAYSKPDFAFIRSHLPPTGLFLDIGANAGMFSLFASSLLTRGGRILSVEPQPDIFARLEFNLLKANDFKREGITASLVQTALGAANGEADLSIPDEHGQASLHAASGGRTVRVPLQTLTDLLAREDVTTVDVMKIDVEGYEDGVLQPFFEAAEVSLWPRAILMEHCNRERWRWDCEGELVRLGYTVSYRDRANVFLLRSGRRER
jgi:FkbM family methyltransferase